MIFPIPERQSDSADQEPTPPRPMMATVAEDNRLRTVLMDVSLSVYNLIQFED